MPLPTFLSKETRPFVVKNNRVFFLRPKDRCVLSAPLLRLGDSHAYQPGELEESTEESDGLTTDEVEAIRTLLCPVDREPAHWFVLPFLYDEPNGTARLTEIPVVLTHDRKALKDLLTQELLCPTDATEEVIEGYGAIDGPAYQVKAADWSGRVPKAKFDRILSGDIAGGREIVPQP